jgi:tripartite-type tricarboxylate transporter receptor subunit TctC
MIGTKFKIVTGYSSSNEIVLAMERGEVEGALGISSDSLAGPFGALVRSGKLRILMQIDLHPSPEPFLQDVPSVLDYVKRPADRAVLDLLLAKLDFGRPFAAPPNTPPAILADLRRAFARMVQDPSFLHDAQTMNIPIQFTPGEDVAQAIAAVYAKPGDVVARAARIVNGGASTP